jgi:hypothetical protein
VALLHFVRRSSQSNPANAGPMVVHCRWAHRVINPGWKFVQLYLYLPTQLVKNGCTYCKRYLNQNMDFHTLTYMWSGLIGQWYLPKKLQKFIKPLELHLKGFNWPMTFPKKFQNFLKTWNRMSTRTKPC